MTVLKLSSSLSPAPPWAVLVGISWLAAIPGAAQAGLCLPGSGKGRISVPAGPVWLSPSSAQLSWD